MLHLSKLRTHICKAVVVVAALTAILPASLFAATDAPASTITDKPEQSWMLVPTLSADPKMGTSLGAMAAYLYTFDKDSPASMFGAVGNWSDTDSMFVGGFARTYFDQDKQRLSVLAGHGEVNNNYQDFLGTGYPLKTTDNLHLFVTRYLTRVHNNLYVGVQVLDTDYAVYADNAMADGALEIMGLNGYSSVGAGIVVQFDNRDNQNSPSKGSASTISNIAYRESLGGSVDFDVYNLTVKKFLPMESSIFAFHLDGRWTQDAPPSGYSSVRLRGYTVGQYLAPNAVLAEVENRRPLSGRWGTQIFVGTSWLYGARDDAVSSGGFYPAAGGGIYFVVSPAEKMVMRLDGAIGKGENRAISLSFGNAF